jgi:putative ABC transport system permease protein
MALESIWSNKVRALLTMLGIIIGIAAVIILISVTGGVTGQITGIFEEMGTNTIQVQVTSRASTRNITPEQIYEFRDKNKKYFDCASPSISITGIVKTDLDNIMGKVTGVSEEYIDIAKLVVTNGRFFNFADVDKNLPVCVVGTYIQKELFDGKNPVGKTLKINGFRYEIIGVLEEKADSTVSGADNVIYIPYTNARKINKNTNVNSYVLSTVQDDYANICVSMLEKFAEDILGDSDYVMVISMQQILESFNTIMDSMNLFLILIAGISLLVGGIGIMNIMLVSVSERTREIGIRKSLGAKDSVVLSQFVIEAGTISSIGGILGILIGIGFSLLIGKLMNLTVSPTFNTIALSFGVSFAIGVIFGFLPARKAAALNPIDALRFD